MSTDTKIKTLIFNKLTQEQYNNADRVPTEFYLTPDTSIDSSEKGAANGVASLDTNGKVLTEQIPVATASSLGGVKPDGTTITVTEDGTISATGGTLVPDYSAGVSVTYPYTAPTAGLFTAFCTTGVDYIKIGGVDIGMRFSANNHAAVFVKAGDVVQVEGTGGATCHFFPLKGATNA